MNNYGCLKVGKCQKIISLYVNICFAEDKVEIQNAKKKYPKENKKEKRTKPTKHSKHFKKCIKTTHMQISPLVEY